MDNPLNLPKKAWDAATAKVSDTIQSEETARKVAQWEDSWNSRRRKERIEEGVFRGIRVIVHRGWVAQGVAHVYVRVVEAPEIPGPDRKSSLPYYDVVSANLRRHAALAIPEVPVHLSINEVETVSQTNRHGFASGKLPVGDLAPGWHPVNAWVRSDGDEGLFTGSGPVSQPDLRAPFAVVSDIDDTVLRTGLDEGITAMRRTLFRDAHTRRPIPGMASLYRGLARGVPTADNEVPASAPFFYVSTGSWSFYEMLTQFLQIRGYPRGPLFLTDWGPSQRYLMRSGTEHKHQALSRLEAGYPELPLVLIGDSGQHDPQIYTDFAKAHPGRVRLIIIIRANQGSAENTRQWQDLAPGLREEGVPLHVVDDANEAARLCAREKMVDSVTVEEVETEVGAVF